METVPNTNESPAGVAGQIYDLGRRAGMQAAAMTPVDRAESALRDFRVETLADARRLLPSWAHYRELSELDVRRVLARFTSVEFDEFDDYADPVPPVVGLSASTTTIPCPPWCATDHARVRDCDGIRQCSSDAPWLISRDNMKVSATASRTIDLDNNLPDEPGVWVSAADTLLSPATARELAAQILAAVELAESAA